MKTKFAVCTFMLFVHLLAFSETFAQINLLFVNLNYESPDLVAPVIIFENPSNDGKKWQFSLIGWTVGSLITKRFNPDNEIKFDFAFTPRNAHSSNLIYRDGKQKDKLSYHNVTVRLKQGLKHDHTEHWTSELSLVQLYESVKDLPPKTVKFWDRPYLGVELKQNFNQRISNNIYQNRSDGLLASGQIQVFTGARTWWRYDLLLQFSKKIGPVFLRNKVNYFSGNNLNTVTKFLVGGNWDLSGLRSVPGYHFAELRVDDGLLINSGFDYLIVKGLELDFRSAYFQSGEERYLGTAISAAVIWDGIGYNLGLGYPIKVNSSRQERDIIFYGRVSFGLLGL